MPSPVKRRSYDSSTRARQAQETRRRIVEAAAALFVRDGYSATSISAIADGAGVAVPTVYASLRSKANILRAVVELTVRGDDETAPLASRRRWQEMERQQDPREQLALFAHLHRQICDREAAVFAQLEAAAGADPEARQLLAEHDQRRYDTQRRLARSLHRRKQLKTGTSGPRGRRRHLDARERAHLSRARTRPKMESRHLRAMGLRTARGRPSTAAIEGRVPACSAVAGRVKTRWPNAGMCGYPH
jgi:TetR/AcrR family transcriptional regulator, regulator of autoinduction and epiphytic fitness